MAHMGTAFGSRSGIWVYVGQKNISTKTQVARKVSEIKAGFQNNAF